jgi:hypothetical protein
LLRCIKLHKRAKMPIPPVLFTHGATVVVDFDGPTFAFGANTGSALFLAATEPLASFVMSPRFTSESAPVQVEGFLGAAAAAGALPLLRGPNTIPMCACVQVCMCVCV